MSEECDLLRLPSGVVELLRCAAQSEVLGSVESMALVLSETGWADPQCARRRATEGSAIARWYLAGEDTLPDDVVELLAADDDPSVVTAVQMNEGQRRIVHEEP